MSTCGPGCGLKVVQKGSDVPSLTDDEAADLGLCSSWISGQRKSYDKGSCSFSERTIVRPELRWDPMCNS